MILPILILVVIGCKTNKNVNQTSGITQQEFKPHYVPGPKALVYQTKANYNLQVPVMLSDDKTQIVSYPHPKDLLVGGTLQTPIPLHRGYLLDKRGISKNVAFIKLTYEEYSKLQTVPTAKELFELIIDNDPLTEFVDCGNISKMSDPENQLNQLIDGGKLRTTCKVIK